MFQCVVFNIPDNTQYHNLKTPLIFKEDHLGFTQWITTSPLVIYSDDLRSRHTFNNGVKISQIFHKNGVILQQLKKMVRSYIVLPKYFMQKEVNKQIRQSLHNSQKQYRQNKLYEYKYTEFYRLPLFVIMTSEQAYFKLQVNLLKIYGQLLQEKPQISHKINYEHYQLYQQLCKDGLQNQWENINLLNHRTNHHHQIINQKLENIFQYYIETCNNYYSSRNNKNHNNHKTYTSTNKILNSNDKQTLYIQQNLEVLHLYHLHSNSIYNLNYFFYIPLSSHILRIVLSAILQESQMIFVSCYNNRIVMVVETIMQMILPLKWCHLYIPILPQKFFRVIEQCFLPYIIGINRIHFNKLKFKSPQTIVICLDSYKILSTKIPNCFNKQYEQYLQFDLMDTSKNYIKWQIQIRSKCILLMCELLKGMSILMNDAEIQKYLLNYVVQERPFYRQLMKSSMMIRQLQNNIVYEEKYQQLQHLINMNKHNRKIYIFHQFSMLQNSARYPELCDNAKEIIEYYFHNYCQQHHHLNNNIRIIKNNIEIKKSQPFYQKYKFHQLMKKSLIITNNKNQLFQLHI